VLLIPLRQIVRRLMRQHRNEHERLQMIRGPRDPVSQARTRCRLPAPCSDPKLVRLLQEFIPSLLYFLGHTPLTSESDNTGMDFLKGSVRRSGGN
jgi:hypothetical protein